MPKIFEYFGFIFYFFSNEHEPIHVHVKHSGTECIFDLIIEDGQLKDIMRREKQGAKPIDSKDEKVAIEFINKYWQRIVEKWIDFFVMKKVVPHPQYNKYLDPALFRTFTVDDGNIVWGEDWDLIFPVENLYMGKAA